MANRTFITGDFHGGIDAHKLTTDMFPQQKDLDKSDVVIILGDIGIVWNGGKSDKYWTEWLEEKPWTTVCVVGNHDNYDLIEQLPTVEKFGAKCWQVSPSVFYIQHGEIAEINGYSYWCMNGAACHDTWCRTAGVDWWPEKEIPTNQQFMYGMDNLDKYMKRHTYIDYIITHDGPQSIHKFATRDWREPNNALTGYLEVIKNSYDYCCWFQGHLHQDCRINDKHIILYNKVLELTEEMHNFFHMNNWSDEFAEVVAHKRAEEILDQKKKLNEQ